MENERTTISMAVCSITLLSLMTFLDSDAFASKSSVALSTTDDVFIEGRKITFSGQITALVGDYWKGVEGAYFRIIDSDTAQLIIDGYTGRDGLYKAEWHAIRDNDNVRNFRAVFTGDYRFDGSQSGVISLKIYAEKDLSFPQVKPTKTTKAKGSTAGVPYKIGHVPTTKVVITQGSSEVGCERSKSCFSPFGIRIAKGDTVTWLNDDTATHTVVSGTYDGRTDGSFDSNLLEPGKIFLKRLNKEGIYDYFCAVHPWMTGQIVVEKQLQQTKLTDSKKIMEKTKIKSK